MTPTPAPADDVSSTIARAADLLERYANFIAVHVESADIELHPYPPEIAGTAEELRAILAARARSAGDGWLPIATAPKDRKILIWFQDMYRGMIDIGCWEPDRYAKKPRPYWSGTGERIHGIIAYRNGNPTHWRPLPAAPGATPPQPEQDQAVPAGWSLEQAERGYSLRSPGGEQWLFQPSIGTGTPSHFIYEFLAAMVAATTGDKQ